MKTINLLSLGTLVLIFAGFLSSCDSISNPEPINNIDTAKAAIVTGTVYANLDVTNDTLPPFSSYKKYYEKAPAGTIIKIAVNNADYQSDPNPSVDYDFSIYTDTTDSDGNYRIKVPALDKTIQVFVVGNSFTAAQTQADSTEKEKRYEQDNSGPVDITAGLTTYFDFNYEVKN